MHCSCTLWSSDNHLFSSRAVVPKWYLVARNTTERSCRLWTAAGLYPGPSERNGYLQQGSCPAVALVGNPGDKEPSRWAVSAVAPGLRSWKLVEVCLTRSHDVSAGVLYSVRKQCSSLLVAWVNSDHVFSSRLLPRASLCTAPHLQPTMGSRFSCCRQSCWLWAICFRRQSS